MSGGQAPETAWVPIAQAYERVESVIGVRETGRDMIEHLRSGGLASARRQIGAIDIKPLSPAFWNGVTLQRHGGSVLVLDREAWPVAGALFVSRSGLDRLYPAAGSAIPAATKPHQKGAPAFQHAVARLLALYDDGDALSGPKAVLTKIKESYGEDISVSTCCRALSHVRQLIAERSK